MCLAFGLPARLNGFILDSYSLRGSTNETLQRHVLSEDNISSQCVEGVSTLSSESREPDVSGFGVFVDSVMI